MSAEEKLTPGVGKVPKVCKSEGMSCSKRIGPTFWTRGGGLEILESCSKKMGPDFWNVGGGPGTLKSPKVGKYGIQKSANPRGGGAGGLLEHCSKSGVCDCSLSVRLNMD